MKNPMATAIDLVAAGDHQTIAGYVATARQNERFANFFKQMMLNDCTSEYDRHVTDMLTDSRYDRTYLCVLLEKMPMPADSGSERP